MRLARFRHGMALLPLLVAALLALGLGLGQGADQVQAGEPSTAGVVLRNLTATPVHPTAFLTPDALTSRAPASLPAVTNDTDSLLVCFAPGTSEAHRAEALRDAGLVEASTIPQLDVIVAKNAGLFPDTAPRDILENALGILSALSDVMWAEPSNPLEHQVQPNDPVYPHQWAPAAVKLPAAWNVTTGSSAVTIAIIDSGLGYTSDFSGRVVSPYSIPYRTAAQWAWTDVVGHGTACAGVAAAAGNDGAGMAGAAWKVNLMPVHVSDQEAATTSRVAEAFTYATDHGADVISVSLGSYDSSQTLSSAVNYAVSRGVVVVAAAGNDGAGSGVQYPGAYPGVIAVGASTSSNNRASFSSTGSQLDLVAPGQSVASYAYQGNNQWSFGYLDGTSFSAPLVAGVAGLMLSHNSSLSAGQVASILAATADDLGTSGWEQYYGDGLLDAAEAVASAGDRSAPTLSFTQPANGTTVRGQTEFVLSVADNIGTHKVEQYLDGAIQFTTMARTPHYFDPATGGDLYIQAFSNPIVGSLDSAQFANGSSHTITAKAYDAAGNVKQASITFTVDNNPVTTTTARPTTTTTLPATTTTTSIPVTTTTTSTAPQDPQSPQFRDVAQDHPYAVQIADLTTRGIIGGFDDGTFRPDAPITRQQFAKMIVKSLDLPVSEQDVCPFVDVMTNMTSADSLYPDHYVAVCAAHGITVGRTATSFAPYANITRAQLMTMVARSLDLSDPPTGYSPPFGPFDDIHYPFARRAAYAGLFNGLQGVGSSFDFLAAASRGEVSAVLYNLMH